MKYFISADVKKEDATARDVFILLDDFYYDIYTPADGQHCGRTDLGYIKECTRISVDEYLKISKGFFTPVDYLEGI